MIAILDKQDIMRMAVGDRLIRALSWRGDVIDFESILSSDKETKDILIKEQDLLRLIQHINPRQKDRRIRLI